MKKYQQWYKDHKSFFVRTIILLFLVIALPLTIYLNSQNQDIRQKAAEGKRFTNIGSLPSFNNLTDLEQQLLATTENGYKISTADYGLCPTAVANQPGWWNPATKKNSNTCETQSGKQVCGTDQDWYFGDVLDGNDPLNDPFYTGEFPNPLPGAAHLSKPNSEARWAGNPNYPTANPHDRGMGYSVREYIPDKLRVGGWIYDYDQDQACFGVGVYTCEVNNGVWKGGGRDGYAQVMGRAQRAINYFKDAAHGNRFINRECALAIAVMEVRDEYERTYNPGSDASTEDIANAGKLNSGLKTKDAVGFSLAPTPPSGNVCHRCSNNEDGYYATFQTTDSCPNGFSQTASAINGTISYRDEPLCKKGITPPSLQNPGTVTDPSPSVSVSPSLSTAPSVTPPADGTDQPITTGGETTKDLNPKVVKDKNGNVHAVWNVTEPEDSTGILYTKLVWDGTKYTQASQGVFGNSNGCASQGCSPAVGVNDSLILYAWAGTDTVRVAGQNLAGVSQFVVDLTQMGFGLTPNIATGPDGTFYIVADGDFKTKYCVFDVASRTCSIYKEITQANSKPEIAVDSSGNIHILAGKNGVHYLTLKNGQSDFTDTTISSGNGQQITADNFGNVYLTWSEDYNIHFCKKTIDTSCSGNSTKVFSDGQATNPSIGVTTDGNILIAYAAGGQTLRYVKYTNNAWTSPASFGKTGSVSVDVSPRSNDSKLSAVWSSDWDIWHRYFAFTGTNTDTPTPTLSQAPDENTKINLTIGLDGIGSAGDYSNSASDKSNKDPKHPTRSLALLFYDEQNNLKYTKLGSVTYDGESGNFKGSVNISDGIAEGRYYVKTKIDQYLLKTPPIILLHIGEENTVTRYTMITGDINGDNHLSLLDYNILANCYSDIKSKSDTCSAEDAVLSDLNDDGLVNQFDYNLFVRELPKQEGD